MFTEREFSYYWLADTNKKEVGKGRKAKDQFQNSTNNPAI